MITVDARMLESSGVGTYLRNLLPRVVQLLPEMSVTVLGQAEALAALLGSPDNVNVIDFRAPIYSPQEQIQLHRMVPSDTKLLWSPHFNIPLSYRGSLLVTIHDTFHLAMPHLLNGHHKRLYARLLFQAVRRKASAILSVSEFTRSEILRFLNPTQPVHTIHLGVDDAWFDPVSSSPPHSKPYIIFLGNIKPHKNLGGLLTAFAQIVHEHNCDLIIVGKREGFITSDVHVAAQAEELGDRVVFTGWLPDSALKQYVAHASTLILPSFYEGFGLPPLEAMACGVPTVVSNATSLPEVCGDASLYCNPHDPDTISAAIRTLLTDHRLRTELTRKGRAQAKAFSWAKCAQETSAVIRRLLVS